MEFSIFARIGQNTQTAVLSKYGDIVEKFVEFFQNNVNFRG